MPAQSKYVQQMMEAKVNGEYRLPPVGITTARYSVAGKAYVKYSVRCEVEGCWFMGGSFPNAEGAERYLEDHKAGGRGFTRPCPTPPRRESLPSGHSLVEKLWRELDEVIAHLMAGGTHREGQRDAMSGDKLKGYANGLAFSIVVLDGIYFPDLAAVSKHALDRHKMAKGEIPFSSTPTHHKTDALFIEAEHLHPAEPKAKAAPPVPTVSPQTAKAIKDGVASGMFSADDMAQTFRLPIELVRQIAG